MNKQTATGILIIGAGPYGISLAYELWERGVPFQIVGKPFDLWFHHTLDTMSIRSDRHTSEIYTRKDVFNLTRFIHHHYPDEAKAIIRKRLPCELFRNYLHDVLQKLPFSIDDQKVVHVTKTGDHYQSVLEDGQQIRSEAVVLATGIAQHKQIPKALASLSDFVVHSWDVQRYAGLRNKQVMVVGGGQSAAECVDHLHLSNHVTWVMRKPPIFYSEPINLPKPIFSAILHLSPYFYYLHPALKRSLGNKFVETTITPDMRFLMNHSHVQVVYEDAAHLELQEDQGKLTSEKLPRDVDVIIAATGYRHDLQSLKFISDELRASIATEKGIPQVNFNFESSVQNFHIIGGMVEPAYGPAQRFMMGSRHSALRLGKVLSV